MPSLSASATLILGQTCPSEKTEWVWRSAIRVICFSVFGNSIPLSKSLPEEESSSIWGMLMEPCVKIAELRTRKKIE